MKFPAALARAREEAEEGKLQFEEAVAAERSRRPTFDNTWVEIQIPPDDWEEG